MTRRNGSERAFLEAVAKIRGTRDFSDHDAAKIPSLCWRVIAFDNAILAGGLRPKEFCRLLQISVTLELTMHN